MNPLDRLFTWSANTLFPKWCQSENHWTSRLTDYLFTDCPCCLLFRGATIGATLAGAIGFLIGKFL